MHSLSCVGVRPRSGKARADYHQIRCLVALWHPVRRLRFACGGRQRRRRGDPTAAGQEAPRAGAHPPGAAPPGDGRALRVEPERSLPRRPSRRAGRHDPDPGTGARGGEADRLLRGTGRRGQRARAGAVRPPDERGGVGAARGARRAGGGDRLRRQALQSLGGPADRRAAEVQLPAGDRRSLRSGRALGAAQDLLRRHAEGDLPLPGHRQPGRSTCRSTWSGCWTESWFAAGSVPAPPRA